MNKKKINKALKDVEACILAFYVQAEAIMGSEYSLRFKYKLLDEALDTTIYSSSQIRRKCLRGDEF